MIVPTLLAFMLSTAAVNASFSFTNAPDLCPPNYDWSFLASAIGFRHLSGVSTVRACLVECSASVNCSAVSFRTGACLLATAERWQSAWLSPAGGTGCNASTYLRMPTPPSSLAGKLLLLHCYRYSFANLVNASTFKVQSVNATRNSTGLYVSPDPSGTGSGPYIRISVPGGSLGSLLENGSAMSVLLKLEKYVGSANSDFLVGYESSSTIDRFIIYQSLDYLVATHPLSSVSQFRFMSSQPGALPSSNGFFGSVGFSFKTATGFRLYINGSQQPGSNSSEMARLSIVTDELRIGFTSDPGYSLSGRILCLALAGTELSAVDFMELHSLC